MEVKWRPTPRSSIATAIFGSPPKARGCFASMGTGWITTDEPMACPAMRCTFFLKTEKELYGLGPWAEWITFENHVSLPSRQRKAWGKMQRQAFWPAEMAQSGSQTMAHSITSLMGPSHPFAQAMVFRVIKSPPCLKTAPGTCGWEWMMDSFCTRTGGSVASPNRITNRLGWWWESLRTLMGISGRRVPATRESLCVSAIFRCVNNSFRRRFRRAVCSHRTHREEFG